ncbi:unnamed protein product [Amoebophrya sp. A120]|nr:unnamed protein product [Amoebophrya sp. A120]|eukprot:GSA120T00026081001.1
MATAGKPVVGMWAQADDFYPYRKKLPSGVYLTHEFLPTHNVQTVRDFKAQLLSNRELNFPPDKFRVLKKYPEVSLRNRTRRPRGPSVSRQRTHKSDARAGRLHPATCGEAQILEPRAGSDSAQAAGRAVVQVSATGTARGSRARG